MKTPRGISMRVEQTRITLDGDSDWGVAQSDWGLEDRTIYRVGSLRTLFMDKKGNYHLYLYKSVPGLNRSDAIMYSEQKGKLGIALYDRF